MTRTHYKTLIENDYLGQWDLQRPDGKLNEPVVVIESVTKFVPQIIRKKKMPDGSYEPERNKRLLIRFKGKRKAWLAGPATQDTIRKMYGPYVEDWIGKKLTLYVDTEVRMGRQKTGGIRVRNTVPSGAASDEPLDNAPTEEKSEQLADAWGDDVQGDGGALAVARTSTAEGVARVHPNATTGFLEPKTGREPGED